jgi:hypothetical protein
MQARLLTKAGVLMLALLPGLPVFADDDIVERPVLAAGDRWVYRVVDGLTGQETSRWEVAIVEPSWPKPQVT